jgi:ribose transport system ATP-binding protein
VPTVQPALEVMNLSKTFPGQRALHNLGLTVAPGQVHALLGENGSGKSTFIKVLAGLHAPDPGGSVTVGTVPLRFGSPTDSHAKGLRFVHQKLGLVLDFNTLENLGLGAGFYGRTRIDWRRQRHVARATLARLGADFDLTAPVRERSAVERTVVAIARAICPDSSTSDSATGASVIVLDEPTSSLPVHEVDRLLEVVRELASSGVAVIYVSHRLDEVERIADAVSVLRDGELVATRRMSDTSADAIVELIVGRKVSTARVRGDSTARTGVALAVTDLSIDRLKGVALSVQEGEIVGVAGVAGSGREQMARALAGALRGTTGALRSSSLGPLGISAPAAQRLGVVLGPSNTQPASAIREFSVTENITLPTVGQNAPFGRMRKKAERRRATEAARRLDVRPLDGERPYRLLSGGNQQKVILARSLMRAPRVLVLDEPTTGVDVGSRRTIYESIEQCTHDGMAVVLISSDFEDILALCDRAVVVRDGTIVAELSGCRLTDRALLAHALGEDDS